MEVDTQALLSFFLVSILAPVYAESILHRMTRPSPIRHFLKFLKKVPLIKSLVGVDDTSDELLNKLLNVAFDATYNSLKSKHPNASRLYQRYSDFLKPALIFSVESGLRYGQLKTLEQLKGDLEKYLKRDYSFQNQIESSNFDLLSICIAFHQAVLRELAQHQTPDGVLTRYFVHEVRGKVEDISGQIDSFTNSQMGLPQIGANLEKLLSVLKKRLHNTVYVLDKILLDREYTENNDIVIQSRVFKLYDLGLDVDYAHIQQPNQYTDFSSVFSQHNRVLLLGNAGLGKSTALVSFTIQLINNWLNSRQGRIPIFVPIGDWKGEPLLNWCIEQTNFPRVLEDHANNGNVIFVLDGLDEIGSAVNHPENPSQKINYRKLFIERVHSELVGNAIVISCRQRDYEEFLRESQKLRLDSAVIIQPLTDSEIQEYLAGIPKLWNALKNDEQLLEIVRTPLLLRIFAVAFQYEVDKVQELNLVKGGDGELRDQIFRSYVYARCKHEAEKYPEKYPDDVSVAAWVKQIYEVLGQLAVVRREDLIVSSNWNRRKHIRRIVKDSADEFISKMCDLNLLIETDDDDVNFIHLLLEYHFAWQPLIDNLKSFSPRGELLLRLGEIRDKRALPLLHLKVGKPPFYAHYVDDMAVALGKIGDASSVPVLINLANSDRKSAKVGAIRALGLIGTQDAITALIHKFMDSRSSQYPSDVQWAAVWALESIGKDAVDATIAALSHDQQIVRALSARTLGFINDSRAVQPLISLIEKATQTGVELTFPSLFSGYVDPTYTHLRLERGEFINVRRDVSEGVFALSGLGRSAVASMISAFKQNFDNEILQASLMWALCQIEDRQLVEFFLRNIYHSNLYVRVYAVYGLGKNCGLTDVKDSMPVSKLINILSEESFKPILCYIIWTLGTIGTPEAIDKCITYLKDFNNNKAGNFGKLCAIGGLGLSKNPNCSTEIIPFLFDNDTQIVATAAQALGRLKASESTDILIGLLKGSTQYLMQEIVWALGEIRDKKATIPLLDRFMADDHYHGIAEALAKIGDKEIMSQVQEKIESSKEHSNFVKVAKELVRRLETGNVSAWDFARIGMIETL